MNNSAHAVLPPAANVYQCTHGRARARQTPEKSGHGIADALPDEFFVAVVFGSRYVVGHNGSQQRVDGSEQRQGKRGFNNDDQLAGIHRKKAIQAQHGKTTGYLADNGNIFFEKYIEYRNQDQRHQRTRYSLGDARKKVDNRYGQHSINNGPDVGLLNGLRKLANDIEGGAWSRHPKGGEKLLQNDDDPDTAHESRNHGVGNVFDQGACFEYAQQDLDNPREGKAEHNSAHTGL